MDGGELQTVREYLGLTIESLAGILGVNPRTVRSWEAGRDPIPERIRVEVEAVEQSTAEAVGELAAALHEIWATTHDGETSETAFKALRKWVRS